jgi:LAS superfamily LD-carboxypeptidase LdcB
MFKQVCHKTFSIIMALLLLLSTVSFTVEKHFCGDVLIDTAVFSSVEKCAKESFDTNQHQDVKASCCKDTLDVIEGQNQLTVKTFDDLDANQQQFLIAHITTCNNLFEVVQKQISTHQNYNPPNLVADIQVRDQVFTI